MYELRCFDDHISSTIATNSLSNHISSTIATNSLSNHISSTIADLKKAHYQSRLADPERDVKGIKLNSKTASPHLGKERRLVRSKIQKIGGLPVTANLSHCSVTLLSPLALLTESQLGDIMDLLGVGTQSSLLSRTDSRSEIVSTSRRSGSLVGQRWRRVRPAENRYY